MKVADRWVVCSCKKSYNPKDGAIKERPVPDHPEIVEIGLECPHCLKWIHMRLDCPHLRNLKQSVDRALALYQKVGSRDLGGAEKLLKVYQRKRKRYMVEYERFHAEWRQKLGIVSPHDLVNEAVQATKPKGRILKR